MPGKVFACLHASQYFFLMLALLPAAHGCGTLIIRRLILPSLNHVMDLSLMPKRIPNKHQAKHQFLIFHGFGGLRAGKQAKEQPLYLRDCS
ncbi:MAG: hypothetical protein WBK78_04845, partial [Syntrophomonadaceae bacterium]